MNKNLTLISLVSQKSEPYQFESKKFLNPHAKISSKISSF